MDSWEMQGEEAAAKALASTWIKRYPPTPDLRDTNGIKQSYKEDVSHNNYKLYRRWKVCRGDKKEPVK